ncbi:hypothetical protein ACFQV2_34850 [Actinokineospora soli]|uniref:Membrane protein involved in the export of O-antigen and teichoic acid n=1 Tax=Actinokineospora soli TaxID=1048753 RepID=A0ABW2TVB8_9PSEU
MDEARRRIAEAWFLRQGLPTIVRPGRLTVRVLPAVVFLAVNNLLSVGALVVDWLTLDVQAGSTATYLLVFALVSVTPLGALAAAAGTARWSRARVADGRGTGAAAAVIALCVLVYAAIDVVVDEFTLVSAVVECGVVLLVLLVLTRLGLGSLLGWAARQAGSQLRQAGRMTSRALPLLLLFTVFGVLTNEVWQMSSAIGVGRTWLLAALFLLVGLLLVGSVLADELRALATQPPGDLSATPLAGLAASGGPPLRRAERANLLLVPTIGLLVQTLVFTAVMAAFYLVFGLISVPRTLVKTWGGEPVPLVLLGQPLPLSTQFTGVVVFMAAFAGLYFLASTVTDSQYREAFFAPIAGHMAIGLSARAAYLNAIRETRELSPNGISPQR